MLVFLVFLLSWRSYLNAQTEPHHNTSTKAPSSSSQNKLLPKLATVNEPQGTLVPKLQNVQNVLENSGAGVTKQCIAEVECLKGSNRLLSKLACSDEVQGVDGAQNLSVQTSSMVRAPERRSNSLEEVEFRKKSNEASGFEETAREHMMEELGVNEVTTPLVSKVFRDLELFQPPPVDMIKAFDNNATFNNRLQTALQFGALVADGFVATIARQQALIVDIGRALIKNTTALAAGEKLTYRSKSLFEFSERGDWQGLREELNRCQSSVESSMIELHDGTMADLISLGGWLRGFQMAAHVAADHYTPEKAAGLVRLPIMDYFIERMDTLSPKAKKRPLVITLSAKLKTLRALAAQNPNPTLSDVIALRTLADEAMGAALSH
ncbi:MAG TPA: hypothetical protein VJK54_02730 [Chthoniobacterales bacterium]|nr:hypothetical protein [Chthoniobacterales bacterium]